MTRESISFDPVAAIYDQTRALPPSVTDAVVRAIVERCGRGLYLELGAGTGRIGMPIVEMGIRYTGVDISEAMLAAFRQKLRFGDREADLIRADAARLPLPDASFDTVLVVHVLHLVPDARQVLREGMRVLRRPGIVALGRNDDTAGSVTNQMRGRWREILADLGSPSRRDGLSAYEGAIQFLEGMGAEVRQDVVAEWTREVKPRELLDLYRNRVVSESWPVPDEVLSESVRKLEREAEREYGDLDRHIETPASFCLATARLD